MRVLWRRVPAAPGDRARGRTRAPRDRLGARLRGLEAQRLLRVGELRLPERGLPGVLEAELRVDVEHLLVRVRVAGADELRPRTLGEDPLEHHGLHPHAEAVAAMRGDRRSALLVDDVRHLRVVCDLGEARALTRRLVNGDDQPPLLARLAEPVLA